jgi:hypothetical protein
MEAREPSAKYLSALQPPLVQHFELMATAPGGVARLRELDACRPTGRTSSGCKVQTGCVGPDR